MPIYEYTCNSCAAEFELLVRDTDEPICPECDGQEPVRALEWNLGIAHQRWASPLELWFTDVPVEMPV